MDKQAHSRDLRKGRISEHGRIYLITTVTHERTPVFLDLALARAVINTMRKLDDMGFCHSLAYVLMPDHLHWLLQLQQGELSTVVGRFKGNSASSVNSLRRCKGTSLWQRGFHDHALRAEEDIRSVARYIVANPLRAGLVTSIADYPHWDGVWL